MPTFASASSARRVSTSGEQAMCTTTAFSATASACADRYRHVRARERRAGRLRAAEVAHRRSRSCVVSGPCAACSRAPKSLRRSLRGAGGRAPWSCRERSLLAAAPRPPGQSAARRAAASAIPVAARALWRRPCRGCGTASTLETRVRLRACRFDVDDAVVQQRTAGCEVAPPRLFPSTQSSLATRRGAPFAAQPLLNRAHHWMAWPWLRLHARLPGEARRGCGHG